LTSSDRQLERAATCVAQAAGHPDEEALSLWREAVLRYAEAYRMAEEDGQGVPVALTRARAHACQQCGDVLMRLARHPEAANVFQEAADLYGQLSGLTDRAGAQECARKALASVAALRANPSDRLYLLIARYERQLLQLAMQSGTLAQQAECCLHIAQIFLRRDRPAEAFRRFAEGLALYQRAEPTEAALLAQAECHHRLGSLLANVLLDEPNPVHRAAAHYEQAIDLYRVYEPEIYGVQENRALCERALHDLRRVIHE
jgi:hypothetical protein